MATADLGFEARRLIRGSAAATLATGAGGAPFAALVTPATAPDLSALMLLSSLSEHTRQLKAEPRCALLFTGQPEGPNPQTAPRVTLTGLAETVPEAEVPALKARWLARHPYAALYADFGDFALWRVRPGGALLVGGFARASRLRLADLLPDPAANAAIAEGLHRAATGPWRLVAVDTDGCDLALGEAVLRHPWPAPVAEADGVRAALIRAARDGRAARDKRLSGK